MSPLHPGIAGSRRTRRAAACLAIAALLHAPARAQFPALTIDGKAAGGMLGAAVDSGFDFDFDGVDDVLLGAPGSDVAAPLPTPGGVAGSVAVHSGSSGQSILVVHGAEGELFGRAVAAVGDTDGDGLVEFAVGAPRRNSPFDVGAGAVIVYSANGAERWVRFGAAPLELFGFALASAGDQNLDGRPDVLIGVPFAAAPEAQRGRALVCSGLDGALLYQRQGAFAGDRFGAVVASIAGGGSVPRIAIASLHGFDAVSSTRPGRVTFFGPTGATLASVFGFGDGEEFGAALAAGPDFDQDGLSDAWVGAPKSSVFGAGNGLVVGVAATTGQIQQVNGGGAGDGLGRALARVPDVDGDHVLDLAVADSRDRVAFHAGATGAPLATVEGGLGTGFGAALASGPDADADGTTDLLVGVPGSNAGAPAGGRAVVLRVPGPAGSLALSDDSPLEFEVDLGGAAPTPQERAVVAAGLATVTWKAVLPPNSDWLQVTPLGGTLTAYGDADVVSFAIVPSALPSALIGAEVRIENAVTGALAGIFEVDVEPLSQGAAPQPCLSAGPLVVHAEAGDAPQSKLVALSNCGNPALSLAFAARIEPAGSFASVTPVAGQLSPFAAPQPLEIAFDVAGLAAGSHAATLVVENPFDPLQSAALEIVLWLGPKHFAPGTKLKGAIDDPADVDEAVFDGLAGMIVEFKGGPKQGFAPRLELIAPGETSGIVWEPEPKEPNQFLLTATGPHRLVVRGDGVAAGPFAIETRRVKLPKQAKSSEQTLLPPLAGPVVLELAALPGAKLDVELKPKGAVLAALDVDFLAPSGLLVALDPYATIQSGKLLVKQLPLVDGGSHAFSVGGVGPGGKLLFDVTLKQPKKGDGSLVID
jgi:hypothetical protein